MELKYEKRDVLVITEKVAALTQGRIVNLSQYSEVSENAEQIAQEYNLDPRLVELILSESSHVFGGVQRHAAYSKFRYIYCECGN